MSSPLPDNAIHVAGLRKGYGDRPVLWDLDLTVAWGELLVLFGSNGAGKTTLLRVLSTQARPDAGVVSVAGFDTKRQGRAVRRRVGVVAHQGFLYDDLTCRENLAFYGRLFSIAGLEARVTTALDRMGMTGRAQPPGAYPVPRNDQAPGHCPRHLARAASPLAGRAGGRAGPGVGGDAADAAVRRYAGRHGRGDDYA